MRKIRYIVFIFVSFVGYSQTGPNPFAEKESESAFNRDAVVKENDEDAPKGDPPTYDGDGGGGNPADPMPIDDYMPILIITAVGIILYRTMKKNAI